MEVVFDRLNQEKRQVEFEGVNADFKPVFVSIATNGYTRILKLDNVPPPRVS